MPPIRLRSLRASVLVIASVVAGLLASSVPASAAPVPFGTVLVPGSAWAGSAASLGDLNVYSNGTGSQDQPGPYGPRWECTELAVRWASIRYGERTWWPMTRGAADMWADGPKMPVPFRQLANGGPVPPQFGDILVFDATSFDPTGHVAVVSGVRPGFVDIVEQNWGNSSPTGRASLPISGTTMPQRWGLTILGWLRPAAAVGAPYQPAAAGPGGYIADGWGGVHPWGSATGTTGEAYWPGWDIVRGVARVAGTTRGYTLDGYGGVHPFGGAAAATVSAYWPGWDIARGMVLRADGHSGYTLDGFGGVHPFGGAPAVSVTGYWPNWDIARSITLRPDGVSGYVVNGWGGVYPFGGAPAVAPSAIWQNWDIARGIAVRSDGVSGWVVDGWGGLHPFGGAPVINAATVFPNSDLARGLTLTSDRGGYVALASGMVVNAGTAPPVTVEMMGLPIGRGVAS